MRRDSSAIPIAFKYPGFQFWELFLSAFFALVRVTSVKDNCGFGCKSKFLLSCFSPARLKKSSSIVGVSNQLSWVIIGISSLRFRAGIRKQNLEHLLPYKNWTYPWGPILTVGLNTLLILVQGWTSFSPSFNVVNFFSFYLEIPVLIVMIIGWKVIKKTKLVNLQDMDLITDRYDTVTDSHAEERHESNDQATRFTLGQNKLLGTLKRYGMYLCF
jgi:AAT family amino acid transporter